VPIGNVVNKGITIRANQASVKRLLPRLIEHVQNGVLDPKALITHRVPLEDVSDAYRIFSAKLDECIKPVLMPPSAHNVGRNRAMEHTAKDHSQIKGWGVDSDPKNDPTYPMKLRNDGEQAGYSWEGPPRQPLTVEVMHSNERPDVTSVFGTSTPPSGLSGALRRLAFRYSESSYGHWLPLVLADRVGVVEGVLGDLTQGRVPNVFAERGWKAEWEHNRTSLLRRVLLRACLISAIVAYFSSRRVSSYR
jgi:hypothetical protein